MDDEPRDVHAADCELWLGQGPCDCGKGTLMVPGWMVPAAAAAGVLAGLVLADVMVRRRLGRGLAAERATIGWEELVRRDVHGRRIEVGDRVRWVDWREGMDPARNPAPGATGWAKAVYPQGLVWFWLDEPTGDGPYRAYWDVMAGSLERID